MANDLPIVMIGLPSTGKTNFVIGLDIVLDSQTEGDGLVLAGTADDRSYLEPRKQEWLLGKVLSRTNTFSTDNLCELHVSHPPSGRVASLHIDDLAGESFNSQFLSRECSSAYVDRVKEAAGVILFIHANDKARHELHEAGVFDHLRDVAGSSSMKTWNIDAVSRQAKLIDLLQFVLEIRQCKPIRVSVVISAWDIIVNAPPQATSEIPNDPAAFLERQWPLLRQFLSSNQKCLPHRIFGVSARGGGDSDLERERLIHIPNPVERVQVVDGEHISKDLSRPIRWIMELLD